MKTHFTKLIMLMMLMGISFFGFSQQHNHTSTQCKAPPPEGDNIRAFALPFIDNVEDSAQSATWWSNDPLWQITSDDAHSGIKKWECNNPPSNSTYNYLTINEPINVFNAINPRISIWIKTERGSFIVEGSSDGGTTWNGIGSQNEFDGEWVNYQFSLSGFADSEVLLRIGVRRYLGYYCDSFLLDDIVVDDAPAPGVVALSQPSNNGMKITWNPSSAPDFEKYRIVLATNSGHLSWNQPVGNNVYDRTEKRVIDITDINTTQLTITDLTFTNTKYYVKYYIQDTLGLFSEGSNTYDLLTSFNVTPENAPFTQTFEGTYQWAVDAPWALTTEDAAIPGHSPTHAFEDSPGGSYPANADRWLVMQANCNTLSHPVLKFNHRYSFDQNTEDYGEIAYSLNNSTWTPIAWFSSYHLDEFQPEEFDLSPLHGQTPVYIRFRSKSEGSVFFDGWHLDDVEIANRDYTNNFPFSDDVEDSLLTHQKWIPGNWETYNTGHSGLQGWQCKPVLHGTYEYLTFSGPIDLSNTINPHLKLWSKMQNYSFFIKPEVSVDGGASWSSLNYFSVNSTTWKSFQWSLADYMHSDVLIRIGVQKNLSTSYFVHCLIDDILIDNAPYPGWFTLNNASNNGMTALWQASTTEEFNRYRLIISTSESATDTWDQSVGTTVSERSETRVIDITDKNTTQMDFTDLVFTNTQYYARLYEMNNQELWNQGTNAADLSTTFNVTPQIAPFVQDFEGTYQWAADMPWVLTEADASFPGHSPTHGYEDSPSGIYPANADRWLVMQVNCNTLTHPVLKFKHRYYFDENSDDYGELAYSFDKTSWTPIGLFSENKLSGYMQEEFDLSPLNGKQISFIRFRTKSGSSQQRDGWRLDDVEIYNSDHTTPFPFYDDVEDDSLTHLNWLPGIWETSNSGHSGVASWKFDLYDQAFSGSGYSYYYLTLNGPVNLVNTTNPELSFWYSSPTSSRSFRVQASTDGGTNWTTIESGYLSGADWSKKTISLLSYVGINVLIRIGIQARYNYVVYIDDIMINDILAAPNLTSPNDGEQNVDLPVNFDWDDSPGAASYYLQVATTNAFNPSEIVFKDSTIAASTKIVNGLMPDNTYYWRVLSINMFDERSPWSDVWSFNTGSNSNDIITLSPGWNLISFDVIPQEDSIHQVFSTLIANGQLEYISGYQNQNGVYFDPNGPGFLNTLQKTFPGEGYWVKVNNAYELSVSGMPILDGFTIDMFQGWNLIGYWPTNPIPPEDAFAELIAAGILEYVSGYKNGGKYYDPNGPPFLNTLEYLENGFGYWVKVSGDFPDFSFPVLKQ